MPDENESARKQAMGKFKLLGLSKGVVGAGLVACGYLGQSYSDNIPSYDVGLHVPFYLGGFVLGALQCLSAGLSLVTVTKGKTDIGVLNPQQKLDLSNFIKYHFCISFLTFPACFFGLMCATLFAPRISNEEENADISYIRYGLIVGSVLSLIMVFYTIHFINTVGKYFGIETSNRRSRRVHVTPNVHYHHGLTNVNTILQENQTRQQQPLGAQYPPLGAQYPPLGAQYPPPGAQYPPPAYEIATNPAFPPGPGNR